MLAAIAVFILSCSASGPLLVSVSLPPATDVLLRHTTWQVMGSVQKGVSNGCNHQSDSYKMPAGAQNKMLVYSGHSCPTQGSCAQDRERMDVLRANAHAGGGSSTS